MANSPGSTKCLLFQNSWLPLTKCHQREPNSLRPFSRHTKLQWVDCRYFLSYVQDPFTERSVSAARATSPSSKSQSNGVCAGKQHYPPPLPGCDTGSFGSGLLTSRCKPFFLSQFTSLLFLHVTQNNSSCLDILRCRGGAKQESNRQYRIRRGDWRQTSPLQSTVISWL